MVAQHCDLEPEPGSLLAGLKCCSAPSQLCNIGQTHSPSPELIICAPQENGVNNISSVVVSDELMCVSCQLLVNTGWWWAVTKSITVLSVLNPHPLWCLLLIRPHSNSRKNRCLRAGRDSKFPAARVLGSAAWRPTRESHSLCKVKTSFSYFSTSLYSFKPTLHYALLGIM